MTLGRDRRRPSVRAADAPPRGSDVGKRAVAQISSLMRISSRRGVELGEIGGDIRRNHNANLVPEDSTRHGSQDRANLNGVAVLRCGARSAHPSSPGAAGVTD